MLSCACKLVVNEEKTLNYTKLTSLYDRPMKKIASVHFNIKCYFIKNGYIV